MDIKSLNEEQLKIADKIIAAAERNGVDPDFALAMAFVESNLNPSARSKRGAVGVMQLMPDTAKELGVDGEDIDQNIEGGIKYLKNLANNSKIGSDPVNILAAYNAGPTRASSAIESANPDDLPEETRNHISKVLDEIGDSVPTSILTSEPRDQAENTPLNRVFVDDPSPTYDPFVPKTTEEQNRSNRRLTQELGGVLGGLTGVAKVPAFSLGRKAYSLATNVLGRTPTSDKEVQDVVEAVNRQQAAKTTSQSARPAAEEKTGAEKSGDRWSRKVVGSKGPGGDSVAEAAENYRTQRDLPENIAKTHSTRRSGLLVPLDVDNPFSLPQDEKQRRMVEGIKDRIRAQSQNVNQELQAAADEAASWNRPRPPQVTPSLAERSPEWLQKTGRFTRGVLSSAPVRGAVGAASVAGNLFDLQKSLKEDDTLGTAISGTGALGGALTMTPWMRATPIGGALAGTADTVRRAREGDYTGAAISGGATLAPWAMRAALGAPLGPAGSVVTMGAPLMYDAIRYKAELDAKRLEEAMKTAEGMKNYWLTRGSME